MTNHGRERGRAITLFFSSVMVLLLSYLIAVISPVGQRIEAVILEATVFSTDPPVPLALVTVPFIAAVLAIIAAIAWFQHGWRRAVWILLASAVSMLASQLLKGSLVRPNLAADTFQNSFPSGHMTVFVACTLALLAAVSRRYQAVCGVLGIALLTLVSWQLLFYGWHRPSDLIGAAALTSLIFAATWAVSGPPRRKANALKRPPQRTFTVIGSTSIILILLAVVGLAAGVYLGRPEIALAASLVVCSAVGGLFMAMFSPLAR